MKLEFIRLDFTDLRYQRADSICDRLDLSDRAFHIHVRWQVAMTDQTVRLILREIDHYIQPSVLWLIHMQFSLKQKPYHIAHWSKTYSIDQTVTPDLDNSTKEVERTEELKGINLRMSLYLLWRQIRATKLKTFLAKALMKNMKDYFNMSCIYCRIYIKYLHVFRFPRRDNDFIKNLR